MRVVCPIIDGSGVEIYHKRLSSALSCLGVRTEILKFSPRTLNYYDESYDFSFHSDESDTEFKIRINKYEKKLEKWNEWCKENKEEIEIEKIFRENKKEQLKLKEKRRLERQLNEINSELTKLKFR